MRTLMMFSCLALMGSPALAQECYEHVSEDGSRLIADQPGEIRIETDGKVDYVCTLRGNGTGNPIMTGVCGEGLDYPFFSAASQKGGEHDLIVFMNTLWYRDCD